MQWNGTPPPEGTPQWNKGTVKWRFMSDYYDGPLSGLISAPSGEFIAGEPVYLMYWAECFEESDWDGEDPEPSWYRRYKVWDLTSASMNEKLRRIRAFEELVGTHWSWNEAGERGTRSQRVDWHDYYDKEKQWKEWKPEGTIIGWFED